jgi:hypothetical protein
VGDTLPELEAIVDRAKRLKAYERIAKYDAPRKLREIANRANRAQQKAFRDELRQVVREAWGPVLDQLLRAKQQLRREIDMEFKRRWEDPAGIDPDEVAMEIHARLRPEVHIRLGYIKKWLKPFAIADGGFEGEASLQMKTNNGVHGWGHGDGFLGWPAEDTAKELKQLGGAQPQGSLLTISMPN